MHDLQTVLDHLIRTAYSMADLRSEAKSGEGEVEAIGGGPIRLALADRVLMVDEATVIQGDIEGKNGVIHVVDAVMIPGATGLS